MGHHKFDLYDKVILIHAVGRLNIPYVGSIGVVIEERGVASREYKVVFSDGHTQWFFVSKLAPVQSEPFEGSIEFTVEV